MSAIQKPPRLDEWLVSAGHYSTRSRSRGYIKSGQVTVNNRVMTKPGYLVRPGDQVAILSSERYVSRGGDKLASAFAAFGISPEGLTALDIGASTGGFTDFLLQHGAAAVWALDVGIGQLHEKIRNDPRVHVIEKTNFRHFKSPDSKQWGLITADVSFISLTLIIENIYACLKPMGHAVILVKPQFELTPDDIKTSGVVYDPELRQRAINRVTAAAVRAGFTVKGTAAAGLTGEHGNQEYFLWLQRPELKLSPAKE